MENKNTMKELKSLMKKGFVCRILDNAACHPASTRQCWYLAKLMLEAGELPNPLATECPIFIGISPNEKQASH